MQVTTGWSIAYPPGSPPGSTLRVLLVLHGRGSSHTDVFASLKIDRFLAAAVRGGVPPFAVVSVDGGDHTYWHARRSGEDPPAMLLDELLPLLARRGLRTERLALGGWSMGGYGALLLAERLGAARVAAVAVDSPALLLRWQDAAHGAFDDADDFARHNVLTSVAKLRGIPVRVTCGTHDPFIPGVRAFLKSFPAAARDLAPGGHDVAWWQHAAPGQLEFVGRHLTA
jgi:pimeloyl-ACP methyl ester carboxylesterase